MVSPLKGIRILDFSRFMQGPHGSRMLADMGAEVIRVESVDSGAADRYTGLRFLNGTGTNFLSMNRNKKSITVDLKKKEGKEIIYQMIDRMDVLLHNFRPGVMERLSLDYDSLSSINPRIIYCSCSGYGQKGPYRRKGGQDLVVQGMSGLLTLGSWKEGPPVPQGSFVVDAYAASLVAWGITLALFYRERTGIGQPIEVCLLNAAIDMQCQEVTAYLNTGKIPQKESLEIGHSLEPSPYGVHKTKDGYITLVGSFSKVCQILDLAFVEEDSRFSSTRKRIKHREELRLILDEALKQRSTEEWIKIFDREKVLSGPVYEYSQLFSDPQVEQNEMVVQFAYPSVGKVKTSGIPVKLRKSPGEIRIPPPTVGQHTDEILTELGYTKDQIKHLRERKII
ncbi:CoA transferase [Candidatus Aerophobetes bacterium]|nr:CoA transferase [Candidatus Aerophobetes bacterium]